MREDSTEQY